MRNNFVLLHRTNVNLYQVCLNIGCMDHELDNKAKKNYTDGLQMTQFFRILHS